MLFVIGGCARGTVPNSPTGASTYDGEKVDVEFYVMSQCPFGTQVEDAIKPVLDDMGEAINFKLDFIGRDNGDGTFQSLHGEPEVLGNKVQLCAAKYNPDKYMEMVECMNKDAQKIPGNWEKCAEGLDVEAIKTCYEGEEGNELLSESFDRAMQAQAQGSPTMYINGQLYEGARDTTSFKRAICQHTDHPSCADIPACSTDADCTAEADKIGVCENAGKKEASCRYEEPVQTEAVLLNDKNCPNCDTMQIETALMQLFKGVNVKKYDIASEQGKKLVDKFGIVKVPAVIFDSKITETQSWNAEPRLQAIFEESDGFYKIVDEATGANWFVSDEKRQEHYDAIGVDLTDGKPQIDFFVMSYCPYGNMAEEAIKPVYDLLKDKVEFNPHYVIYSDYGEECVEDGQICSMHGGVELRQDIREMCVLDKYGTEAWFDFALEMNKECDYKNADTCYVDVAKELGYDLDYISECENGKGLDMIKEDKELGDVLGVSGSPQIFVEGDEYAGARSAEAYKQALCAEFDTAPEECGTTLAGATDTPPAGNCG